jgi:hypothetical protein
MPSISSDPTAVSVGFSTKLGASLTATGVATAIVAFATGDRSEQTLGVIAGAAVAALAFAITAAGRYAQSRAQIKTAPALVQGNAGASPVDEPATLDAEAQAAHEEVVDDHGIENDEPDVLDGLPDLLTTPHGDVGEDAGDPMTRGEVPA